MIQTSFGFDVANAEKDGQLWMLVRVVRVCVSVCLCMCTENPHRVSVECVCVYKLYDADIRKCVFVPRYSVRESISTMRLSFGPRFVGEHTKMSSIFAAG